MDVRNDQPQGLITPGQRAEYMRQGNASAVLRAVLAYGPVSRAEIARHTGLSAPSVTKLTSTLIDVGLLGQLAPMEPTQGRPRVPLRVDPDRTVALGLHIGVLRSTFGLVGLDGRVLAERELAHAELADTSPQAIADQAVRGVRALLDNRLGERRLVGTGVSIGGWVDGARGRVVEHGPLGWHDVDLLDLLGARLPGPVVLEQTVRAIARAELWFGAGREVDDFVLVFIGNVQGAAIVVDRTVHRGPGAAAGGIEHLLATDDPEVRCPRCGTGCLSEAAGDIALAAQARAAGVLGVLGSGEGSGGGGGGAAGSGLDLERLVAAARPAGSGTGDVRAQELLRRRARRAGRAVATIVDLLNPSRVVLAGGILVAEEYLDDLRAEVALRSHRGSAVAGDIVPAVFGARTLVRSSAVPMLERVITEPFAALGML
ncbi:putative NBD/HSP70 family sugar kinase [Kitasatospora sp. MAP12-15]|uniref:ROK family transcriptional regulator n=1 Tax=unclassified Kitasatospora TaxID=2633591 RepID=UPI002476F088|nr:ROK family transcriptional regulator [Kitasatospora sp. MAP12-44]MDH6110136.1 putative NBD/HSP70 family sugar kinase [Kitasatospora sp. MAP12-44]